MIKLIECIRILAIIDKVKSCILVGSSFDGSLKVGIAFVVQPNELAKLLKFNFRDELPFLVVQEVISKTMGLKILDPLSIDAQILDYWKNTLIELKSI